MTRDPIGEQDRRAVDRADSVGGPSGESNGVPSARRRQLIKGLATGGPFLLTVASRPVQGAICTPSAWVSGNLSQPGRQLLSCGGKPLRYWMTNHDNRWSTTGFAAGSCAETSRFGDCTEYASDGTPFHSGSIGRVGVFPGARFGDKTLMQVLWLDMGQDPFKIGGHMVAALLNAASMPDYGMNVAQVVDIYRQLEFQGYYQPSGGQPMFAQDVVLFIRNTFS